MAAAGLAAAVAARLSARLVRCSVVSLASEPAAALAAALPTTTKAARRLLAEALAPLRQYRVAAMAVAV